MCNLVSQDRTLGLKSVENIWVYEEGYKEGA